jgi:replicative DNA helicase
MTEAPFRSAPHNLEAEQALLGAILVNNEAHDRVSSFLEPHHFFDPLHKQIYETVSKLIASGKQAKPITLMPFFQTAEPISADLTVPQYLGRLAANAATIINARDYGRTIHDLATRRGLIVIGEDVVNAAYDSPVDFPPKEQIEEAEARLYALVEGAEHNGEVTGEALFAAAIGRIEEAHRNGGQPSGLSTGLKDLDAKIGPLRAGQLIIVAGRPGMAKTSLATEIIRRQPGAVTFFSQEMTTVEIGTRMLVAETGLPSGRLEAGDLNEFEWRLLLAAKEKLLGRHRLVVDPTGSLTIGQLSARARRIKRRHDTSLIVVDYIQLMKGAKRTDNRNLEVTEITSGLKALAKELNVPVIALSQLNREVEKREDKRPQLSDLRDSGAIEQDADIVLFLYREEYYLEQRPPGPEKPQALAEWMAKMAQAAGKAEVIVAKHRHRATGVALLQFEAALTRFSDLACSGQVGGAMKRDAA